MHNSYLRRKQVCNFWCWHKRSNEADTLSVCEDNIRSGTSPSWKKKLGSFNRLRLSNYSYPVCPKARHTFPVKHISVPKDTQQYFSEAIIISVKHLKYKEGNPNLMIEGPIKIPVLSFTIDNLLTIRLLQNNLLQVLTLEIVHWKLYSKNPRSSRLMMKCTYPSVVLYKRLYYGPPLPGQ